MAQSQRPTERNGDMSGVLGPLGRLRSTLNDALSVLGSESAGESESTAVAEEDERTQKPESTVAGPTQTVAERHESNEGDTTVDLDALNLTQQDPEDALYALLRHEGGQMKQSRMVSATGWSKSKVSRRLSNLEDNERIGRVRQGREKVVFVKPGAGGGAA